MLEKHQVGGTNYWGISMKKYVKIVVLALFVTFIGYYTMNYYRTYSRVNGLYENRISNYLSFKMHVEDYYQSTLTFPSSKEELDSYLKTTYPSKSEDLLSFDYKIINSDNQILIYDNGFDNTDDSASTTYQDKVGFFQGIFKKGDYLIHKEKYEFPEKLLIGDYFLYDADKKIVQNQTKHNIRIDSFKQKLIRDYYRMNFDLDNKQTLYKPSVSPDTILLHSNYTDSNGYSTTTIFDYNKNNILNVDACDSLLYELRQDEPEISEFYITVVLPSSKDQLLL